MLCLSTACSCLAACSETTTATGRPTHQADLTLTGEIRGHVSSLYGDSGCVEGGDWSAFGNFRIPGDAYTFTIETAAAPSGHTYVVSPEHLTGVLAGGANLFLGTASNSKEWVATAGHVTVSPSGTSAQISIDLTRAPANIAPPYPVDVHMQGTFSCS